MILTSIASLPFPPFDFAFCIIFATIEVLLARPHILTGNVWEGAPENLAVPIEAAVPVVIPDLAGDIHLHLLPSSPLPTLSPFLLSAAAAASLGARSLTGRLRRAGPHAEGGGRAAGAAGRERGARSQPR